MLDLCRNLHEQYDKLSDEDKRRLVMLAFKSIELKRGRIGKKNFSTAHFEYTEPFQALYEGYLKRHHPDKISGGGGGSGKGKPTTISFMDASLINIPVGHPEASGHGGKSKG